jgi:hypothetical protein
LISVFGVAEKQDDLERSSRHRAPFSSPESATPSFALLKSRMIWNEVPGIEHPFHLQNQQRPAFSIEQWGWEAEGGVGWVCMGANPSKKNPVNPGRILLKN